MHKRSVSNSPRLKELKKKRRLILWAKILLFVFSFSAVIAGLSLLSRIDKFNIAEVEASGNKIVHIDEIRSVVNESISGNYLYFFPKTNFLFYPKDKIMADLGEKYKRLKDITFSIKNNRVLHIAVSEREGVYTWCGMTPPEVKNADPKCYFIDESGYVFDEAPYFSGDVYFKFYGGTSESPSGSYFAEDIFKQLLEFSKSTELMGLKNTGIYLDDAGDIKLILSRQGSTYPEVMFKRNADFSKVVENLETALATEPFHTDFKKKYASLKYIDLRFGNKVYYKFNE